MTWKEVCHNVAGCHEFEIFEISILFSLHTSNGLLLADFQKAFDLVNYDLLIEKLRIYGLGDNSLDIQVIW